MSSLFEKVLVRRIQLLLTGLLCSAAVTCTASGAAQGWKNLLDPELSQWETYLSFRHAEDYSGKEVVDQQGAKVAPIGYGKDPDHVFSVVTMQNEPVLRVSGEVYGCVFTKQEFSNYHLKLKVKWGTAKWTPRKDKLKDTGILYHSVGPAGVDYFRAWMLSQEFQIMEGHMGDYWSIANSAVDIRAFIPENAMNSVASEKQPFRPFGAKPSISGFCLRSADYESAANDWTELELVCFEGKSLHIVNGHVVMVLQNSRAMSDGVATPLTRGKIQLQSEAAEVFFSAIQIRELSAMPAEYAHLFR